MNPTSIVVNSPDTTLSLSGTGFTNASTVQVNGQNLSSTYLNSQLIQGVIPAPDLTTVGATLSVTVTNPGTPASNGLTIPIGPYPLPVLSSVSPASTPTGGPAFTLSVSGSGFVPASVVRWNGSDRPTTYGNSSVLTANITASDIQTLGNSTVTVFSPTPGGGTSSTAAFTTYVPLTTNDLIYDPTRSVLWASIPSSAGPSLGNSVISIDPYSGAMGSPIWVGSEPNLLSLSGDGTTLWVSLDGSPALRKIDLTNRILTPVQPYFPGGWGGSFYAGGLAVMPGTTSTIAVYAGGVSIFDDATARPNVGIVGTPYLAFGSTASTLYGETYTGGLSIFTVNSSGIASTTSAGNSGGFSSDLRYDNGRLYLTSGGVLDGGTGNLLGTFAAQGSVAPDSTLGRAFILNANPTYLSDNQITAFDLNTFLPIGALPVGGVQQGIPQAGPLVRWGADGLAFRTPGQVFILRDSLVKDLSGSPADVAVSVAAPASTSTGTNTTVTITATNHGPNPAPGTAVLDTVPASAILVSATPSQGSCASAPDLRCDLGTLASGASATVTVLLVPETAGSLSNPVSVVAATNDPNTSNNSATSTITVTGSGYNPAPVLSSIAPNSAVAGSASFSLTVDGTGFANTSTVNWNGQSLPTSFTSSNELTATVSASLITASGSADITVSSGAPGGGTSTSLPFAIIQAISLTTNDVVFEPFSRKIYATIPSTAAQVAGNSVVAIDPLTGVIGTPIPMGSEPTRMAISDDGVYLYVALAGSNMVRRVNLLTGIADTPFTTTSPVLQTPFTASDLAVMPGNNSVLATVGYSDGIQVWDVTATGATPRTLTKSFANDVYEGSVLAWGDSTHLYSNDEGLSPSSFHRFLVGPTSFAEEDSTYLDAVDGRIAYSGGLIFADGGGVVDPSPAPPNTPRLVGRYSSGGVSAADASINRVFFMTQNNFSTDTTSIEAFDASHFTPAGTMILPPSDANDLIRWGADGLAFRTSVDFSGQGTPQVVILRGFAVLPRSLTPNPVPSVASASPSVTAPASNTWLTLSGSQFVPGAVAMWNGSARTTVFVNGGLLRVAIPAADLATHQTATIQVVNPSPGGSASGTLNLTVN